MFKNISITNKTHAAYIADAIAALYADMDWLTADDLNMVRIYKKNAAKDLSTHTDYVAIPDVYCDEGTEFTTLRGATVRLDSGKWGEEIITETEW